MTIYRIDTTGLIVCGPEDKPQLAGYICNFNGNSHDPSGGIMIGDRAPTQTTLCASSA